MPSRSLLIATLLFAAPAAIAQTAATPGKPAAPSAMSPAPAKTQSSTMSSGSVGQYTSASDAAAKCAGDTVVWANPNSKALHLSGDHYFGKSKKGFYACEKDAMAGGYHLAGHKKHAAKTA